jgi:CRISPR/Cas system CSM-associated protein Csm3 (group 7 of RAMP superfamily)
MNLVIKLLSDTTFGRGDGVAGLVDEEIEYDSMTGLPIIRGRTLKGLLVEECANILYALQYQSNNANFQKIRDAAKWLFGEGGSTLNEGAHMRIGRGELPTDLRQYVLSLLENASEKKSSAEPSQESSGEYTVTQILDSLTTIRRQTAVNEVTGTPEDGSLRASRVALRDLTFRAVLDFDQKPNQIHLALLAACASCIRRVGSGRNRGRGRVETRIEGTNLNFDELLKAFEKLAGGVA